jgi:hypothetical protein
MLEREPVMKRENSLRVLASYGGYSYIKIPPS